jgi:hypothetical protein
VLRAIAWRQRLQSLLPHLSRDPVVMSLFRPDATWTIPGRSVIAGEYRGRLEIAEAFAQLGELSDGSFELGVEDSAIFLRHAYVTGRIHATRDSRVLDQPVALELDLSRSGVRRARMLPPDQRVFDEFWGIQPAILSHADRDALGRAFHGAGATGALGWWARLLVALVAAGALLWFVSALQAWRISSRLSVASHNLAETRQIESFGQEGRAQVGWILEGATAGELEILGPGVDTIEVILPIARIDACRALSNLGYELCDGPIPPPVTLRWPSPALVSATEPEAPARVDELDLTVSRRRGAWVVGILARGGERPSICFGSPGEGVNVTISVPGGSEEIGGLSPSSRCEDGFVLNVGGGGGALRPSFEFHRVEGLQLTGTSPYTSLDGLNGSVALDPGDAYVLTTKGEVSLTASSSDPVSFSLSAGRGQGGFESAGTVTSVLTEEGELVQSEWDHRPWLWGPMVGALLTFAVLTPLTGAARTAAEWLGQLDVEEWLVGRWRRERSKSRTGRPKGASDEDE